MPKDFLNAFINDSNVILDKLGADVPNAPHKAVMFDNNGNLVLAADPSKAVGLILSHIPQIEISGVPTAQKDTPVSVLIKNIGLAEAGAAVKKGDLLTVNTSGQVIPATSGNFIFGRAFSSASAAGESLQVQVNPMGFVPTASGSTG